MTVIEIVAEVAGRFDSLEIPYAVGGSLASSAWGQMRQTNDADLVIRLDPSQVDELLLAFPDPYSISRSELQTAISDTSEFRTVQLLHIEEAFKIDLFLLRHGAYETSELERARTVEVSPDVFVRFYAPENVVIAKLRWFELGNRVSDRQWHDLIQVLEVQKGFLDEGYLRLWSEHFSLGPLLEEALRQTSS